MMLSMSKDVLQPVINSRVGKDRRRIRSSIVSLGRKLENIWWRNC